MVSPAPEIHRKNDRQNFKRFTGENIFCKSKVDTIYRDVFAALVPRFLQYGRIIPIVFVGIFASSWLKVY